MTLVGHRTVTTSNVNKIANSLVEKLGQCNEMFAKLQEMTNKQVEKYTSLSTANRKLNNGIRANKYRIKCANKGEKTHAREET